MAHFADHMHEIMKYDAARRIGWDAGKIVEFVKNPFLQLDVQFLPLGFRIRREGGVAHREILCRGNLACVHPIHRAGDYARRKLQTRTCQPESILQVVGLGDRVTGRCQVSYSQQNLLGFGRPLRVQGKNRSINLDGGR